MTLESPRETISEIYAIRNNGFGYRSLDLTLLDIARFAPEDIEPDAVLEFNTQNSAMSPWWKTPDTAFVANDGVEDLGIPDLSTWIGASLVLSPKAYRYLGDTLKEAGELLPVTVNNETFYIFNCHSLGKESLGEEDLDQCDYEMIGDTPVQLDKLAFQDSAKELTAFKSRYETCLTVFCNERLKSAVESYELTGVVFDRVLVEGF